MSLLRYLQDRYPSQNLRVTNRKKKLKMKPKEDADNTHCLEMAITESQTSQPSDKTGSSKQKGIGKLLSFSS